MALRRLALPAVGRSLLSPRRCASAPRWLFALQADLIRRTSEAAAAGRKPSKDVSAVIGEQARGGHDNSSRVPPCCPRLQASDRSVTARATAAIAGAIAAAVAGTGGIAAAPLGSTAAAATRGAGPRASTAITGATAIATGAATHKALFALPAATKAQHIHAEQEILPLSRCCTLHCSA